jgi:selenide,water dikinase
MTIEAERVPVFTGVLAIASANRSGGLGSNEEHFGKVVQVEPGIDPDRIALLFDPQTSGGLLVAVGAKSADEVGAALMAAGVDAVRMGSVGASRPGPQVVVQA